MKKHLTVLIVIALSIVFIALGSVACRYENHAGDTGELYSAKVVGIDGIMENKFDYFNEDHYSEGFFDATSTELHFSARITKGDRKGEVVDVTQPVDGMFVAKTRQVEKGDSILIHFTEHAQTGELGWVFTEHNRVISVMFLCIAFLLLVLIIGKGKGLNTIIALLLTCTAIFMVYIPSILSGYNVYMSTIVISVFIVVMCLLILDGVNKKTFCAILGNIGGLVVSGLLVIIMSNVLRLTGFIDTESLSLSMVNPDHPLDLKAIIFGGIIIGALGAIMDVAMSIASALNELAEHMENKSFAKLWKSGMNIGRDAIGTMTNTLILAYIGGSLAVVLLLVAYAKDTLYLFNMEMIVVEIMQGVIGSIGILFAVPITAALAAYMFNDAEKDHGEYMDYLEAKNEILGR